jgi:hypothetical protein
MSLDFLPFRNITFVEPCGFPSYEQPKTKSVLSLQVSDLEKHPVWQFGTDDEGDETAVRPVNRLPVFWLDE